MIVLFLVDEYTDHKHAPVVSEIIDVVIDVLHHPEKVRPEGEMVLGEMTRQSVRSCSLMLRIPPQAPYAQVLDSGSQSSDA